MFDISSGFGNMTVGLGQTPIIFLIWKVYFDFNRAKTLI